ncbi:MAG TPA: 5-formyltetrahydrofolate cyclo-ligase [Streptosporangiaceae bacterium]|nr:5-formyltetrahydrofolate cyclo-ligase [Streptosporangiaceae bacterium]
MPQQALTERKSLARRRVSASRAKLPESDRHLAGTALLNHLLALPEVGMAGTIAAYVSIGAEPPTNALIYALWKRGCYVLLPVLRDDLDLDWASYEGPSSLAAGPRGLLQPTEPLRGVRAIASADFVVVPALAVGRDGYRLGRGGGSYDRALARVAPMVPTVALLYERELVDAVPVAEHDQRVSAVAQPVRGITRLG